ncbi:hypothetical protein GALMADRAFT_155027 [Galerina marginata CBS 339.88]|uniref:Uncharacterized protein n=1 Tax=Galerina marginata (strain CBS 339.88) TaxID=685588 RepID=A0A067TGC0_GALM3|nr:hypothetical protein GALMADRAFT_155027 [Galerina marginata CBS 339.88]
MSHLSYKLTNKGQLNLPGSTYASKKATEELLLKDAEIHHCFFRGTGFHNHLGNHILAAYDLGASAGILEKIYENEAQIQRPRVVEGKSMNIVIDKENWVQYLGTPSAYSAFITFFSSEVQALGASGALEKYVFENDANENGVNMLVRVMSGAIHPFIQIGYGAEFGNDTIIATGLAQAAVHAPLQGTVFNVEIFAPPQTVTLLELLREVYDSEILRPPVPYQPKAFINARMKNALANGGAKEIERICAKYYVDDAITDTEISQKTEECIWLATLLTFATGKKGRKPRLDFLLMHLLTSSLFLRPICGILKKSHHKAALIRAYIPVLILVVLSRGRPRINPELLMSYTDVPRPPLNDTSRPKAGESSLGAPENDVDYNPWPAMIEGVLYHPDSHIVKAMRTLVFGAQHFGATPAGGVVGSYSSSSTQGGGKSADETHIGMAEVDGTIFVRAAGILMDTLGWVSYGRKGEWDRSAHGWDAAWESGD